MAFTLVNTSQNSSSNSTSLVVSKPTDTTDGDVLFCQVMTQNGYVDSIPSDWISLGKQTVFAYHEIFYKIASGEGANYTWGNSGGGKFRVVIASYRGSFNSSDPIDVISNTVYDTANTTIRAASISATNDNSPLLFFAGTQYNAGTLTYTKPSIPTTDWVEDFDGGDSGSDYYMEFCSMVWTGSGATGDIDATMSDSLGALKHAFAVILNTGTPIVTTEAVSDIIGTTALGNGTVVSDNGFTITERGICWNSTGTPTTFDTKNTASGTTGAFSALITGLEHSKTYYVRAYAINSVGTSYGTEVTFTSYPLTTWTEISKTRAETPLAQETDFDILLENGYALLVEDSIVVWGIINRNTSTWSQNIKNTTTWASPLKN